MKLILGLVLLTSITQSLTAGNTDNRMLRIKSELSDMKNTRNPIPEQNLKPLLSTPEREEATVSPQARNTNDEYEQRLFSLLEKCQLIGAHLEEYGEKADKARKLYGDHCFQVLDTMAIEQELDVFYLPQARYLSFNGRHHEAGRYITESYQLNPRDFATNHIFIRNLIELGQNELARELYDFFLQNEGHTLNPSQLEELQSIEKMLTNRKDEKILKVFKN